MKRDVVKKFILNIQRSTTVQQSRSPVDEEDSDEKKALLGN